MRLIVQLRPTRSIALPVNCQEPLQGAIYSLLGTSDADYTRFLHDDGYTLAAGPPSSKLDPAPDLPPSPADSRRFKLFVYSGLRAATHDRRIVGDLLHLAGGSRVTWQISSPVADFLTHCANGLLTAGVLRVGSAQIPIEEIAAVPAPAFGPASGLASAGFTCLTPIVAAVPATDGRTTARYLRPTEGEEFSEAVRKNLLAKYRVVHGHPPDDDRLRLTFSPSYLARNPHAGTKKIIFKQTDLVGALAPFTLEAATDLLALAWETGLGQANSMGFGMIDIDASAAARTDKR